MTSTGDPLARISDDGDDLAGRRVGRYEITRLIREFATDSLYLAHDPLLARQVTLKIQNIVGGKPIAGRLVRNEAAALARLSHPGIHRIYDTGTHDDGRAWFVAEELGGGTLREVFAQRTTPPPVLLRALAEVCDAVGYAHRRGIVHRNVSDGTVRFDASGLTRVTGFSLSLKTEEAAESGLVGIVASTGYASPEELSQRREEIGPRSDVWSLGVLIHEAAAGVRPYGHDGIEAIIRGGAPPPRPRLDPLPDGVPATVDAVISRCLEPRPQDRYADGSEVAAALRAALGTAPRTDAARVFVSHSSKDREWVEREIVGFLERSGIPTWYAKADINSAEQWERTIVQGLESCTWFVLVMSPNSAESDWVRDEVFWALAKRPQRVLPVLMAPCDPWKFHIRMARIQHIDFHADAQAGQRALLDRLSRP